MELAEDMLKRIADSLDQTAHLTALHNLLVLLVKTHPAKAEILEGYRDMMAQLSDGLRERARPDAAQADPLLVQAAEGSVELLAQLADGQAQFAEKLQEHVERLLRECQ